MLSGSNIGDEFDQTQIKASDFVCSAVMAPLLMTALNIFRFAHACPSAVYNFSASEQVNTIEQASKILTGLFTKLPLSARLKTKSAVG